MWLSRSSLSLVLLPLEQPGHPYRSIGGENERRLTKSAVVRVGMSLVRGFSEGEERHRWQRPFGLRDDPGIPWTSPILA